MSRFVRPETLRLEISHGDWLLVKKQLNAGEQRQAFARLMRTLPTNGAGKAPSIEIDPIQAALSTILAYLVDWSLTDDDGKPVVIRNRPVEEVIAALDALDTDSFAEIQKAVNEHESTQAAARRTATANPFTEGESLAT